MKNPASLSQLTFTALSVLLAASTVSCSRSQTASAASALPLHAQDAVRVQEQTVIRTIQAAGTVQPVEEAPLAPQMPGTILAILVQQGSRVQAGQVLARINPALPQAGLQAAQANLLAAQNMAAAAQSEASLAASTLQRYKILREKQSVSPQEFDEVQQRAQAAQARLQAALAAQTQAQAARTQASAQASYTQIRAPFAGIIAQRNADPGALASPGIPIFVLERTDHYRLEVPVDEHDLGSVSVGTAVPVSLDLPQLQTTSGTIAEISPAADASSRSFLVKIDLPPSPLLRSGIYGSAQLPSGQIQALLLPRRCIVQAENLTEVYALSPANTVQLRYITVGQQFGDSVAVLSGLAPGDLVLPPALGVSYSGKQVEVLP